MTLTSKLVMSVNDDNRCLQFIRRKDLEQRIEVYEYTRHAFGSKEEESLVTAVLRNFYMDDFLKSVRTPQEAIETYQSSERSLAKVVSI